MERSQRPALEDELLALLALTLVPGLGSASVRALRERHGSAVGALAAAPEGWSGLPCRRVASELAGNADLRAAQRELERAARIGAWLLHDGDPRYPEHWRSFSELPPLLYVRGAWPDGLQSWPPAAVAVVGSRRASTAAVTFSFDLGNALARAGAVVVSGLAYGVDAAAHEGALAAASAGAPALAVVASGVDRPGPAGNAPLARAILAAGGAVLSEAPIGHTPARGDFPRRNRLVAALARAVVVVAAGEASGAHLTAGHAARFGRDVFVCPAHPWDEHMAGNLALLRDGAAPLCSVAEAPTLLGFSGGPHEGAHDALPARVPSELVWAWEALSGSPLVLDELVARSNRGVAETLVALERLVALGACEVDGSRRYRRQPTAVNVS